MAKVVHDDVLDGAWDIIRNNCTRMTACAGQPASFAAANIGGANFLADVTMAATDFTKANGDTSGRKVTAAQKTGVTVDNSGTADHVALLDVTLSKLLYVTTATSQALTAGNTMTFNAWDAEIADPT